MPALQDGAPSHAGQKRKRREKPLLEPIAVDVASVEQQGGSKFARALGSTDFLTRERGVLALTRFLQHKSSVSHGDMVKLWKGLYFCFWHSDKAPVQVGSPCCLHRFSHRTEVLTCSTQGSSMGRGC